MNVIPSPSLDDALAMVRAGTESSSRIVPVAVPVVKKRSSCVSETVRLTVKVSPASTTLSSVVGTVKVCCSPESP